AGSRGGAGVSGRGRAGAGARADEAPLGGEERQPLTGAPVVQGQRLKDQLAIDGAAGDRGEDRVRDKAVEVSASSGIEIRVGGVIFRGTVLRHHRAAESSRKRTARKHGRRKAGTTGAKKTTSGH